MRIWARHIATAARPLIVLFAVLVALGPAAPFFARLAAGPSGHVCHCQVSQVSSRTGHAHCECPICFPELRERHELDGRIAIKGVCGDDDPLFQALPIPGVIEASSVVILPAPDHVLFHARAPDLVPRTNEAPDPRPPRAPFARI